MPLSPETRAILAADKAAREARQSLADSHSEALELAAGKVANALQDRDLAIRAAFLDGIAAPVIAEAVGLTRQRVYQIARPIPADVDLDRTR